MVSSLSLSGWELSWQLRLQNENLQISRSALAPGYLLSTGDFRVENSRAFGGPWLALQLIEQLKLDEFLHKLPHKEALEIHLKNRMGELFNLENRRYLIGTNKALLKKFEHELLKEDWNTIRDGIEVKLCKLPKDEDSDSIDKVTETFILCRRRDRKEKDKAIVPKPRMLSESKSPI